MYSPSTETFYWHDYETFGADPKRDKPAQFAGMRTDANLNPIGDPLVLFCKPADDMLPSPEACLITGITPQQAASEGVVEAQFIAHIYQEMSKPHTCTVGYNNLNFDDEVTRHTLYRNFYDPYDREYKNGNSRWDLINVVRLTYALRPEGIQWPDREDEKGVPSFKLETLTKANGLVHANAHDALSDVEATIGLARLIKQAQPKLYDFALSLRDKSKVLSLLEVETCKPIVHVSSRIPAKRGCCAMISPLAWHPSQKNAAIVFDLSVNPQALMDLSVEEIRSRVFVAAADLPEGVERLPLKLIRANRCPMISPAKTLTPERAEQINLSFQDCRKHWDVIKSWLASGEIANIRSKLQAVFSEEYSNEPQDAEVSLYSGGFCGDSDKRLMTQIRRAQPRDLAELAPEFVDPRYAELYFRYRARNFPETLNSEEHERWQAFRYKRLMDPNGGASLTFEGFAQQLRTLMMEHQADPKKLGILQELEMYAQSIYPYEVEMS